MATKQKQKYYYDVVFCENFTEYGDVHIMNCNCVSSFLSVSGFYRQVQYLA